MVAEEEDDGDGGGVSRAARFAGGGDADGECGGEGDGEADASSDDALDDADWSGVASGPHAYAPAVTAGAHRFL